jgi:hypothetical protein
MVQSPSPFYRLESSLALLRRFALDFAGAASSRAGGSLRLCTAAVEHVMNRHNRMAVQHLGACVAHYNPDSLPHLWPVAMHRTLGAGRFPRLEGTFLQALPGIILQLGALRT